MKITKILSFTFAIVALMFLIQCTSNENKSKQLHLELNEISININQVTPAQVNTNLWFHGTEVTKENVFQYYYTIVNVENPKEWVEEQKKDIQENFANATRTNKLLNKDKLLRLVRKNKLNVEFIYRDTTENIIDIITITPELYK